MRISSISVAQPRNFNYNKMRTRTVQNHTVQEQQPAFKGWKAGLGGLIGTGAGVVIGTVLSGGALLPALLLGAAGTTGGCIYGSSKEDHSGDDYIDHDPCYPNYRDY